MKLKNIIMYHTYNKEEVKRINDIIKNSKLYVVLDKEQTHPELINSLSDEEKIITLEKINLYEMAFTVGKNYDTDFVKLLLTNEFRERLDCIEILGVGIHVLKIKPFNTEYCNTKGDKKGRLFRRIMARFN